MPFLKTLLRVTGKTLDSICQSMGIFSGLLLICIVLFTAMEVTLRYIFNSPTMWSLETNQYLMVSIVFLPAAYVVMIRGHIRVDLFIIQLPKKVQAWINFVTAFLSMLVVTLFLSGYYIQAVKATQGKWTSQGALHSPEYPAMWAMVVGFLLLALALLAIVIRQGLSLAGKGPDQWGSEVLHEAEVPLE